MKEYYKMTKITEEEFFDSVNGDPILGFEENVQCKEDDGLYIYVDRDQDCEVCIDLEFFDDSEEK